MAEYAKYRVKKRFFAKGKTWERTDPKTGEPQVIDSRDWTHRAIQSMSGLGWIEKIQGSEYEAPDPAKDPLAYTERDGGWFYFADGTKKHGRRDLEAELSRRREEAGVAV